MGNVADIGPVEQVLIGPDLELGLTVPHDLLQPGQELAISLPKDACGSQRAGLQLGPVGSEHELFSLCLSLVVGVQRDFGHAHPFVNIDEVLSSVVYNTSGRGVDEFSNVVGEAGVDDGLGTDNVDLAIDFGSHTVNGRRRVDDHVGTGLLGVCDEHT